MLFLCLIFHQSTSFSVWPLSCIYIYIYAFSRRFYPKWLTVHSGYTYFCQCRFFLGIEPTTFCAANAMLHHWVTGTYSSCWVGLCFTFLSKIIRNVKVNDMTSLSYRVAFLLVAIILSHVLLTLCKDIYIIWIRLWICKNYSRKKKKQTFW